MEQTELTPGILGDHVQNPWDADTLRSRINPSSRHVRFEGGSPDKCEVILYRKGLRTLLPASDDKQVLVLGMTPEIRQMALEQGYQVTSVDRSAEAIALYSDWVDAAASARETVIQGDWFALEKIIPHKVDAILGDGVFGNILTLDGHHEFLCALKRMLRPGGVLVLRQALIPRGFHSAEYEALGLVNQFRAGTISEAEFGFSMRLWGSFDLAYDPATCLLDNAIVFARYREWVTQSLLRQDELALILRYYFGGKNLFLPQRDWEMMLSEAGFHYRVEPLAGKGWYAYYPIYVCHVPHA